MPDPTPLFAIASALAAGICGTLVAWTARAAPTSRPNANAETRSTLLDTLVLLAEPLARLVRIACPPTWLQHVRRCSIADPTIERLGADRFLALALATGLLLSAGVLLILTSLRATHWSWIVLAILPGVPATAALLLSSAFHEHQAAVRREFPYALDLLVLLCRAGASTPLALQRTSQQLPDSPFANELARAIRSMDLGAERADALRALAARVDTQEVSSFVDTILQAEALGRPVADALELFADRLREQRAQNAESLAGAAGVKVLVPGIVVLLGVMILLFSPFALRLIRDGISL